MERVKCQKDFHLLFSPERFDKKNCLEYLSNEIFYEVFDYLDGHDIYKAFSNLNHRFQNLLIHSSFLMKIEFSSSTILNSDYRHFLDSNKHRIISFHFTNESIVNDFITFYTINSSFIHFESLVLNQISTFKLVVLLCYLKSLPRLESLTISLDDCCDNLGDIYQIIFHLSLKYLILKIPECTQLGIDISITTNDHISSLKYLIIGHCCSLNQLIDLLSYTPQLSHLQCCNTVKFDNDIQPERLMKLPNLVHLTISANDIDFYEFKEFLLKLCSRLEYLNIRIEDGEDKDNNFLDANRWEELILRNLIYLKEFRLSYVDYIDEYDLDPGYSILNRFTSSFWIERQWIFQLLIDDFCITYLIRPHRTLEYDFQEHIEQLSTDSSFNGFPGVHLNIEGPLRSLEEPSWTNKIIPTFEMVQITCLDIQCNKISVHMLIKILNLLPHLVAIRLLYLPSDEEMHEFNLIDTDDVKTSFKKNKITKLTLKNPTETQIHFIIDFFPCIQSLSLQHIPDLNIESVLRYTFLKIKETNISCLRTICVFGLEAQYDKAQKLKQMIDKENLLKDYIINRRLNRFYIQWKRV